jgi:hypothetical protein
MRHADHHALEYTCSDDATGTGHRKPIRLRVTLRREEICRRACKPNSVEDGHSSRRGIAADVHQRPTRRFPLHRRTDEGPTWARRAGTRLQALGPACGLPPYLVLLRVGFTLPPTLQPERCALTAPFHPYPRACARWRYLLCGTSRLCALTRRSRTLSGTLPCGVRTFLPRTTSARQRPSSPPAWLVYASCSP